MKVKICAPISAADTKRAITLIRMAEKAGADLIEVRLDHFDEKPDLQKIVSFTSIPLIATNRRMSEG